MASPLRMYAVMEVQLPMACILRHWQGDLPLTLRLTVPQPQPLSVAHLQVNGDSMAEVEAELG